MQTIYLAGGCFWCVEAIFEHIKGVISTECGYSNGKQHIVPTYEKVCTGHTNYAEVVQVGFDESVISLHTILDIFFQTHNPTTLNRQGNDIGTQYRSGIYAVSTEQYQLCEQYLNELKNNLPEVVTELLLVEHYYSAEIEHQHFFERNPYQGYCQAVIPPKINKLKQTDLKQWWGN